MRSKHFQFSSVGLCTSGRHQSYPSGVRAQPGSDDTAANWAGHPHGRMQGWCIAQQIS